MYLIHRHHLQDCWYQSHHYHHYHLLFHFTIITATTTYQMFYCCFLGAGRGKCFIKLPGFKIAATLPVIFHRRNRKNEMPWSGKSTSLEQLHLHLHAYLKRIEWRFKSFLNCKTLSVIISVFVNHHFVLATLSIWWHSFCRRGIIRVK